LRAGVRREHELPDLPDRATLEELTSPWKPYRSIGTWYIWRSFGVVPQST
jgi:DNA-3-methyladenine glycosylase II